LTALVITGAYYLQYKHLQDNFIETLSFAERVYEEKIQHDIQTMEAALLFIKADQSIQREWKKRDKKKLLALLETKFKYLRQQLNITHLYFTDLTGRVFLRVHNPNSDGDIIKRQTTQKTLKSRQTNIGLEFGIHHNFTLRNVQPWYIDGELSGLIEIGEEVAHLTDSLAHSMDVDLFLVFDKTKFKQDVWEKGIRLYGHENNWDFFDNGVVIGKTMKKIPKSIEPYLNFTNLERVFELNDSGTSYLGSFIGIKDISNKTVAKMVILKNITQEKSIIVSSIISLFIYCLISYLIGYFWFKSHLNKLEQELDVVNKELERQAYTDLLTQIPNRRYFFEYLRHLLVKQNGEDLAVFIMDLDNFKAINDTYGHDVGDNVLKHFTKTVQACIRKQDILARFGGEEFVLAMPGCPLNVALEKGEMIRASVADSELDNGGEKIKYTISIGVSPISPMDNNIDLAIKRADNSLYKAKKSGKNQIVSEAD